MVLLKKAEKPGMLPKHLMYSSVQLSFLNMHSTLKNTS